MSNYFVMLQHPNAKGGAVPMTAGEMGEDLAWFDTREEARECAKNNLLGDAYGYSIFEMCDGCD